MFAPSDAVRSLTLPTSSAIKCNALNLSRYWKTGLSAESQPHPQLPWDGGWIVCQLTGRSPVLPRYLTQPYEEMSQDPLIGNLQWCCTPFFGELWDQGFLP